MPAAAWALVLCLVGAALKLGVAWYTLDGDLHRLVFSDEGAYYLAAAQEVNRSGWAFFSTPRVLWNGPLNPLWIWALGMQIPLIKICNVLLVSLCGWLLWDTTRRHVHQRAAWLALAAYTFHAPLFVFAPTLLTEPLFVSLVVVALWLIPKSPTNGWQDLPAALVLGLATLVRPTTQLLPLALLLAAGVSFFLPAFRPSARRCIGVAFGMMLVIGPYVVRNGLLFGTWGIANGFGAVLYLGSDLRTSGDEPVYAGRDFDTYRYTQDVTHLDSAGDARLKAAALSHIARRPARVASLWLLKPLRYLLGSVNHYFFPAYDLPTFIAHEAPLRIMLVLGELLTTVFVVTFGLWSLVLERHRSFLWLCSLILIGYFTALHTVAFAIPRLALPLFPLLALWAVAIKPQRAWIPLVTALAILGGIGFSGRFQLPNVVTEEYASYFDATAPINLPVPSAVHDIQSSSAGLLTVTGVDPFVVYQHLTLTAAPLQTLLVKVTTVGSPVGTAAVDGQLFWSDPEGTFAEERSVRFYLSALPGTRWYRVTTGLHPRWRGPIDALRFDLGDGGRKGEFRIEQALLVQ